MYKLKLLYLICRPSDVDYSKLEKLPSHLAALRAVTKGQDFAISQGLRGVFGG